MTNYIFAKHMRLGYTKLLAIVSIFLGGFLAIVIASRVSANDTIDYLFSLNNIKVIPSSTVSYEYPTWAKMNPEMDKTSLGYWVKKVLPFEQDRYGSAYLVYPKAGIVVPVLTPSKSDAALIAQGKSFNHYPYLENGSLHYFGISPSKGPGNMSIAAHSSYIKKDTGRYKTIFQALVITKPGDIVWYFQKNSRGTFDRYEYEILESYETDKYNVSILNYDNDGKTYLTTYGCYPIGSTEGRWVNKALLKDVTLEHSSLDETIQKTSDTLGLPVNLKFDPGLPTPQQLIGHKATNTVIPKNTLTAGSSSGEQQDVVGLSGALSSSKKSSKPKSYTKLPTTSLVIDVSNTSNIMKNIIVQTTKLGVGDIVEMPTILNPILAKKTCYTPKEKTVISLGKKTKARDQVVFQGLMNAYGLTSYSDTDLYNPDNGLKRNEAAKILVNFAKNVLCRQSKDTYTEGMYNDIAGTDATLVPYIKQAYEFGIMKGGKGKFRPLDRISKQEFIAGMMRILLNSYLAEGNTNDWYKNYEKVFADYGLKTLILTDKTINRYDMSKLFYRIYYSDAYQLSDAGYVLPNTVISK